MNYHTAGFEEQLHQMGITLTEKQLQQFLTYYEMLIEKNKVMNLTTITEFDEVMEKHFVDSLSIVQVMDLHQSLSLIDLGTGAGFPGIPLKIVFPELHITLADSLNKRILFLQEVIDALELEQIQTVHGRAEELARQPQFRECYDLCVSRAVANLSTLSEYCLPFVKIDGRFISYKAGECEEEVAEAKSAVFLLGGKIEEVKKFDLGEAKRAFVTITKTQGTPKKYPRKAGTPSKNPL
jgi:16S rRNA (guanine527-N7)-methyltransferase